MKAEVKIDVVGEPYNGITVHATMDPAISHLQYVYVPHLLVKKFESFAVFWDIQLTYMLKNMNGEYIYKMSTSYDPTTWDLSGY